MHIILQNFRCYGGPTLFTIEPQTLTLLQGKSGDGKSTLLSAIQWCLFGGLKGANLKPIPKTAKINSREYSPEELEFIQSHLTEFAAGSTTTVAIVVFSENLIVRRRSASTSGVEVVISSNCSSTTTTTILRGAEATAHIEQIFGQKKQWSSSSYLPQSMHHALLTDSNADKFTLLKEITFGSSDSSTDSTAEKWTSLIANKTSAARNTSALASAKVAAMRDVYESVLGDVGAASVAGTEISKTLTPEEIHSLEKEIQLLESHFVEQSQTEKKQNLWKTRFAELTSSKHDLEIVLENTSAALQKNEKLLERRRRELESAEHNLAAYTARFALENEIAQTKLSLEQFTQIHSSETKRIQKIQQLPKLTPEFLRFSNLFSTIFEHNSNQPTPVNPLKTVPIDHLNQARQWLLSFASLNISEPNTPAKIQEFINVGTQSLSFQIAEWRRNWEELCELIGSVGKSNPPSKYVIASLNNLSKYRCLAELEENGFQIISSGDPQFQFLHLGSSIEFSEIPEICEKWEKIRAASESKQFRKLLSSDVAISTIPPSQHTKKFKLSDIEKWEKLKTLPVPPPEIIELLEKIGTSADRKNLLDSEIPEKILNSEIKDLPDFASCTHTINLLNSLPSLIAKSRENEEQIAKRAKAVKILEKKLACVGEGDERSEEASEEASEKNIESQVAELSKKLQHTDRENMRLLVEQKSIQAQLQKIDKDLVKYADGIGADEQITAAEIDLSALPFLRAKLAQAIKSRSLQQAQQKYEVAICDEKTALSKEKALTVALDWLSKSTILALSETVSKINEVTNAVLSEMFVDPISVELILLHKSTSASRSMNLTSTTGNSVSLTLIYKGQSFSSFELLSGGEKDRLSLALTIASALYADSKLILLDECLGSLDDEAREMCFEVIRKYLAGRTVVHVSHSDFIGEYEAHLQL